MITGIASQESAETPGPPASATAPAIMSSLPIQAPNITYSGRAARASSRSAAAKNAAEGTRNSSGHQPVQAAEASDRHAEDRKRPLAIGAHAVIHIEHALAVEVVRTQP